MVGGVSAAFRWVRLVADEPGEFLSLANTFKIDGPLSGVHHHQSGHRTPISLDELRG